MCVYSLFNVCADNKDNLLTYLLTYKWKEGKGREERGGKGKEVEKGG